MCKSKFKIIIQNVIFKRILYRMKKMLKFGKVKIFIKIALALLFLFPLDVYPQDKDEEKKDTKKEKVSRAKRRADKKKWKEKRKQEKKEKKAVKKKQKKLQDKKTYRRMKRNKRKANRNNRHQGQPFFKRIFSKGKNQNFSEKNLLFEKKCLS